MFDRIKFLSLFFIFLFSCSGGNNRTNYYQKGNVPSYETLLGKDFLSTKKINTTSFPLEVSTSSYSNFKEAVDNSSFPSQIFTEELLNSFSYNYPKPKEGNALGIYTEAAIAPWDTKRKLIHIGIYSAPEEKEESNQTPPKNVVIAVDTSGSMSGDDRMGLAKNALKNFMQGLSERDTVAIVEYTDQAKIDLPPTSLRARNRILDSISALRPTGGTNAWPGILLAYKLAKEMKKDKEQTKIVIVTDGDFGGVNNDEFLALVEKENKAGITISILCFDSFLQKVDTMDLLASSKKGESFYIKSMEDVRRFLSNQSWSTWNSVAKDINLEVKFNPNQVESFRLIGFEKYRPNKIKKSYEIPSSFSYTALYEIMPNVNSSKNEELVAIKLNYKTKTGKAEEIKESLLDSSITTWDATDNFRFAAGVAGLGMILNSSIYKGNLDYNMVIHLLQSSISYDPNGDRLELLSKLHKIKD